MGRGRGAWPGRAGERRHGKQVHSARAAGSSWKLVMLWPWSASPRACSVFVLTVPALTVL